jgi:hypothetical protein
LIKNLVQQAILPIADQPDQLIWKHNSAGILPLKEAFSFKKHHPLKIPWTKCIRNRDIPPSKAMMVWRLMMGKLPTDENLELRGYVPCETQLLNPLFTCLLIVVMLCAFGIG